MYAAEQGVRPKQGRHCCRLMLPRSRLPALLTLLLVVLLAGSIARADTSHEHNTAPATPALLRIAYDSAKPLQKQLAMALLHQLSKDTVLQQHALRLHLIDTGNDDTPAIANKSTLLLSIGKENLTHSSHYAAENRLYLLTSPGDLDETQSAVADKDAVLYMTQPWCRQLHFISLLNPAWKKVGVLSSQKEQQWQTSIHDCARKHQLEMLIFNNISEETLSASIRSTLRQSDLLLAVPDGRIYNRRTVRNILLTSYRLRKPLIAYSRNFVDAGALAAIHSNIDAIAATATTIIRSYFDHDRHFDDNAYYPTDFEISINPQVFKALNIDLPDPDDIRQKLQQQESQTVETNKTEIR